MTILSDHRAPGTTIHPGHITVTCPTCPECGKASSVEVDLEGWRLYRMGAYVQVAFPTMPAAEREMLISGTHPDCWNRLFAGLESEV